MKRFVLSLLMISLWTALAAAQEQTAQKAAASCRLLPSLTGFDLSIDSAVWVEASGRLPSHCLVTARVLPEVRFVVGLPDDWNGRLVMLGNGGWGGRMRPTAFHSWMRKGYAGVVCDTGHDGRLEPDGTFAADRQKLADFAYRAVHVSALAAKEMVATYYEENLNHSYFFGCSQGGRQGLIAAQRFPGDFDGIVSGAPILDFTGQILSWLWTFRWMEAAPLTEGQLAILGNSVFQKCDDIDGLQDGIISEPNRCSFDPAKDLPVCWDDSVQEDCLTRAQIQSLEKIYAGPVSDGESLFPGRTLGMERPAWRRGEMEQLWNSILSTNRVETFVAPFFRFAAFEVPNPDYRWQDFDFERDVDKLEQIRHTLDATDPDLTAFKERGGKLLMYHGWLDPTLNPTRSLNYYEEVSEKMGPSTPDFFRLFMVPGMFHCLGGTGVTQLDRFDPLIDWVEKGTPPERIIGSRVEDGQALYTRPLCPHPQVARYTGPGPLTDAESFSCVTPSPLQ